MNIYPGPPHDEDGFFWRSDCKDDVEVIYVVDYGFWYPWYYSFPYYYGYGDCGIDWDGPVTPEDCSGARAVLSKSP